MGWGAPKVSGVDSRIRVIFNSDLKSRTYIVPGLLAVILMMVACVLTSLCVAREWENGIVVAVDAKDGMVATEGWAEVSDVPVVDLARRFEDAGVASLLFTDIGRDGLLKGVNIDATVDLARRVDIPVIASGGVKGLDDIHILALHAHEGIEGVITGRALYEGRLDLAAAIAMGRKAEGRV